MRDLLIADETARLILKTEGGLGELAGGGFKQAAAAQLTKTITARPDSAGSSICRRDALRKFYMGQRLDPNTLEWVPAAAKACRALTEREFVWVIRSVDPDQSGVLDRHELTLLLLGSESCLDDKKKKHQQQLRMQCAAALTRQAEHKEGMAVEEKVADYRRIFHLYDTDKSGEISWTELQAVLTTVTGHVPAESEVKDMIATVDEDGSVPAEERPPFFLSFFVPLPLEHATLSRQACWKCTIKTLAKKAVSLISARVTSTLRSSYCSFRTAWVTRSWRRLLQNRDPAGNVGRKLSDCSACCGLVWLRRLPTTRARQQQIRN